MHFYITSAIFAMKKITRLPDSGRLIPQTLYWGFTPDPTFVPQSHYVLGPKKFVKLNYDQEYTVSNNRIETA